MSAEQNKSIVLRWVESGWNQGNLAMVNELYNSTYTMHDATLPMPVTNSEAFKQFVTMYRTVFPDLRFTVEDVIAEGDKVAWRFRATGTQRGPFGQIPPSGKPVNVSGTVISRFDNGKWAEDWVNLDVYSMLQQIGVVPSN